MNNTSEDIFDQMQKPIEVLADEIGIPAGNIKSFIEDVISDKGIPETISNTRACAEEIIDQEITEIRADAIEGYIQQSTFNKFTSKLLSSGNPTIRDFGSLIKDANFIDETDAAGETLLFYMVSVYGFNKIDGMLEELLLLGADPNISHNRQTPLHIAVKSNNTKVAKMLIEHSADPTIRGADGNSSLTIAISKGNHDMLKLLKSSKIYKDKYNTLIDALKSKGHNGMDLMMIMTGNRFDEEEGFSGMIYDFIDDIDVIKASIDLGSDINGYGNLGLTPLMLAAHKGNTEVLKMLISAGADPKAGDPSGKTALDIAVARNDTVNSKLLKIAMMEESYFIDLKNAGYGEYGDRIKLHMDLEAQDSNGGTLLFVLAFGDSPELLVKCLSYGADFAHLDTETGWTPLIAAAKRGLKDNVKILLDAGADPKTKIKGWKNEKQELVPMGSDILSPSKKYKFDQMDAADFAEREGYDEVAEFIRKHPNYRESSIFEKIFKFIKK